MATHKVFVYGTLKRNEPNHHWLTDPKNGNGTFLGEATTKNKYPLIIATKYNIPFLLKEPGSGNIVKGEVYEIDEIMLLKLDELEDHPNYYVREIDNILLKTSHAAIFIDCGVDHLTTASGASSSNFGVSAVVEKMRNVERAVALSEIGEAHGIEKSSEVPEAVECWVYFLQQYQPHLLDLPHLEDYSSSGPHGRPYAESSNESTIDDLNDENLKK